MNEYIKRDDVIDKCRNAVFVDEIIQMAGGGNVILHDVEIDAVEAIPLLSVLDIPSADVRENISGHWDEGNDVWYCSNCGSSFDFNDSTVPVEEGYYFCPWCGADMRGESDE